MRFDQLEYFNALVSLKTIQAVSEKFYTSPQVVSTAVKQLEKELETTLFTRTRNGLILTNEGIALYPHVEELLNQYRYIQEMFNREKNIKNHELKILTAKGNVKYFSDFLNIMFQEKFEGTKNFVFDTALAKEINQTIYTKNDYDIITTIVSDEFFQTLSKEKFIEREYIMKAICREPIKIWTHKNSIWGELKYVTIKQMKTIPFVKYNSTDSSLDTIIKSQYGFEPLFPYCVTDLEFALKPVQKQKTCILATESYISSAFSLEQRKDIIPLKSELEIYNTVVFFIKKAQLTNPYIDSLLKTF